MARLIALVPIGLAIGSLLEWLVARRLPASLHRDLAQPLAVATAWHGAGLWILCALGIGVAIAAAGYIATIVAFLQTDAAPHSTILKIVMGACALGLIVAFFAPVLLSSDVYAYATYGEMARQGIDPYSHAHLTSGDPIYAATIWQWSNPPPVCVYGPLFVDVARIIVGATAGLSVASQLDALRVLEMLALLACVPLASVAFAPLGDRARLIATVAIGLNPIAIWSAAEGHNDAVMLAVALAGFASIRRLGPALAVAIVTLSASIKAPGAAAAIAYTLMQRGRNATMAWAGLIAAGGLLLWWLLPATTELASGAHAGAPAPGISLWTIGAFTPIVIAGLLAIVGIRALRRGEIEGWIVLALAIWCALPNPYPWYGLWFLPIAALAPRSRPAMVILALTLTTTLRYLPDVYGTLPVAIGIGLSVLAFAPLLALLQPKSAILSNPV
jgi:hypothetical protein